MASIRITSGSVYQIMGFGFSLPAEEITCTYLAEQIGAGLADASLELTLETGINSSSEPGLHLQDSVSTLLKVIETLQHRDPSFNPSFYSSDLGRQNALRLMKQFGSNRTPMPHWLARNIGRAMTPP